LDLLKRVVGKEREKAANVGQNPQRPWPQGEKRKEYEGVGERKRSAAVQQMVQVRRKKPGER